MILKQEWLAQAVPDAESVQVHDQAAQLLYIEILDFNDIVKNQIKKEMQFLNSHECANCGRIMDTEKIKEVFSDEEYVKSLLNMHSYKEVQESLEEKDIDLSINEIRKIHEILLKKANGELTDEELENVAGGYLGLAVFVAVSALVCGVPITTACLCCD